MVSAVELTIHRGAHEIGGSCVELRSASGGTRVLLDIGMPLVNPDSSPFNWRKHKEHSQPQLIADGVLPRIDGLFAGDSPAVAAVLLSHAHQDHYGLLRFVHPDIPLFMSRGTKSLAEVSNLFLDTAVRIDKVKTFAMWRPFRVGEFAITPYLMDHSAPDTVAFLIEVDGQRVFYTGDFSGHGRKGVLLDRITRNPPADIDYLLMEGSMMGRDEGPYPDEDAVEEVIYKVIHDQESHTFIFCSSQNLDRLVSVYRAAKRAQKTLVIDLYTAFVLDKLRCISSSIPQFDWSEVRVLYAYSHARKLAELDKRLLYKYKKARIEVEELRESAREMVVLSKDNPYFRALLRKLDADSTAKCIYSMWHGYLERNNLARVLDSRGIALLEIHTSGHAYVSQLKMLADALKPRFVIPIHTFHPESYAGLFPSVLQLHDGETISLEKGGPGP